MMFIDPDCLACVKCHRVIATVGTGQWHLLRGGRDGVCCDECKPAPELAHRDDFSPCWSTVFNDHGTLRCTEHGRATWGSGWGAPRP